MYWRQVERKDKVISGQIHEGNGLIRQRDFFRESSKLPINFSIWELDPGVSEGNHSHGDQGSLEEIYYFLDGEGVMVVDGDRINVCVGDAIMVPPGVAHEILSTGNVPLKLAIIWGRPEGAYSCYSDGG